MIVGIYIRVSTVEQAEQGFSIDIQKDRLISFCNSQGWEEYKMYIDDGYTGTNINRPALKRLIKNVEEKKIDLVLVYKLDRLSRKQKHVMHLLEDVFEPAGAAFRSAQEPFDTSTAFGKASIGMLSVFAQLERDMIIERTTGGRRERISQGKWHGGPVPFGYNWNMDAQVLEIRPEEASIVREIYKMYLQGQSRLAISEWAASRSKARTFDHSTIRDMLARPIYNGKLFNAGAIVEGNHEPIIDDETWYAAQRELSKRRGGLTSIGEYLLTGLLCCGVCGGAVVHVKRRTRGYLYELYACKNQHVRMKDRTNHCTLGYTHREKIEKAVIEEIKSISLNPNKIKEYINKRSESYDDQESVRILNEKMGKINDGLDNLYEAIQSGEIKASRVSDRIKKLEEERESIEMQLDDLAGNLPKVKNANEVYNLINEVGQAWDYLDSDEQKALLRKVIQKITLYTKKDPEITWSIE